MPTLVPVTFVEHTNTPFVWYCSGCKEVFALGRMTEKPSLTELHRVNANFLNHCKRQHVGEKSVGLDIPTPNEDSSQSAVRIVREATENK